jgi:hypothetical protein
MAQAQVRACVRGEALLSRQQRSSTYVLGEACGGGKGVQNRGRPGQSESCVVCHSVSRVVRDSAGLTHGLTADRVSLQTRDRRARRTG